MKDKMKGLLLGLAVGTLLSGSIAYASGTQIEVAFRSLKYMFDGVEKQPTDGKGFIYNGSTYVPLRFVSEALGKQVEWDDANSTIWVGDKTAGGAVVAAYTGGTVTKGEFDTYVAIQNLFNPGNAQSGASDDYRNGLVKQLVEERWFEGHATDTQKADAAAKAKAQLSVWQQQLGGEEALRNMLASSKLVQSDLEQFAYRNLLVTSGIQARVTDDMLRASYDAALKSDPGSLMTANVRQVLIALKDPATGKDLRTQDEALKRAQELIAMVKAGGDFATLAKSYNDDPGSKDTGGLYTDFDLGQTVPEFKKAAATLPLNQMSDPVLTDYGYHVMIVESRTTLSFEAAKERLKDSAYRQAAADFAAKELPGIIQSIQLPK